MGFSAKSHNRSPSSDSCYIVVHYYQLGFLPGLRLLSLVRKIRLEKILLHELIDLESLSPRGGGALQQLEVLPVGYSSLSYLHVIRSL